MVELNIGAASKGELAGQQTAYKVDAVSLDAATDANETTYQNTNFPQYLGYYKKIPELKQAIDAKAKWTLGKGFKADPITTLILDRIIGWGKESFNSVLQNMIKSMTINGDSYAEIILDDNGFLLNLKVLDPGSIKIVADRLGMIIRYEQTSKVKGKPEKKFQPEQILHFSRDRIGDEIHGVSVIESVEQIILMRNEAMSDWKRVLHRNIDPLFIYHLDTDDTNRIREFKNKMDATRAAGENIYVPKEAVVPELVSTTFQAGLNPLPWIESLNQYFYQAVGVPDIILGSSKLLTEASAKIAYLAWEQTIEEEQLYIEEQILSQLNLVINLEFPASLQNELLQSQPSSEVNSPELQSEPLVQENELQAGISGRT